MSVTDERTQDLTPEQQAAKIAARKAREAKEQKQGVYGTVLFAVGLAAALVAMWVFESISFATLWIGVAMVGGRFLAAGDIKGLFGGGS